MDAKKKLEAMLGKSMLEELPEIMKTVEHAPADNAVMAVSSVMNNSSAPASLEVLAVDVLYDEHEKRLTTKIWVYVGSSSQYSVVQAEMLKNGEVIGTNTLACSQGPTLDLIVSGDVSALNMDEDKITVHVGAVNKQRKMGAVAFDKTFEVDYIMGMKDVVKGIDVADPRNIQTPPGTTIHVSFDRKPQLNTVDYDYSEYRAKSGLQEVYLDMSGDINLNPGYTFKEGSYKTDKIILLNGDTICQYANSEADVSASTPNKIHYKYPNKWICNIPKNVGTVSSMTDFRAQVTFEYTETATGKVSQCIAVISSRDYGTDDVPGNFKKIPDILFYWGCLEENTPVTMSDGTQKKIKDVQIGEYVKGVNGKDCEVRNIIRGEEEMLLCITLSSGKEILLTKDHPFMTKTGAKAAIELEFEDEILTEDGYERIEGAYPIQKKFNVYSLELTPEDYFWGSKIAVGDSGNHKKAIEKLEEKQKMLVPDEIVEECRKINKFLHKEYL